MKILDHMQPLREPREPVKTLKKLGTIAADCVETTPVVWQGKLLRFEWVRTWNKNSDGLHPGSYRFVDMNTNEYYPEFAFGHSFGCCYTEGGTMFVHGVRGRNGGTNVLDVFCSNDLVNWECKTALTLPEDMQIYNTSVDKGSDGYIMAIEIGGENPAVGVPYTIIFAKSKDLFNWELLPTDKCVYDSSRYTACPVIRFCDGMWYMISLEEMPFYRYVPYITRTKDFETFEMGRRNPVMFFDNLDRNIVFPERFTNAQIELIKTASNNNNSDVDLCEYEGKTYILYSWGNQLGTEFLAEAVYDGKMEEFLKSFFG